MAVFNMVTGGGSGASMYIVQSGNVTFEANATTFTFLSPITIDDYYKSYDILLFGIYRRQYPNSITSSASNRYTLLNMTAIYSGSLTGVSSVWKNSTTTTSSTWDYVLPAMTSVIQFNGSEPSSSPGTLTIESLQYTQSPAYWHFSGDYNYIVYHMKGNAEL